MQIEVTPNQQAPTAVHRSSTNSLLSLYAHS